MTRSDTLGTFEQLVLTAVLAEGEHGYGITIHARVAASCHRRCPSPYQSAADARSGTTD